MNELVYLFVYGIFLHESTGKGFGMQYRGYAVLHDFATRSVSRGSNIVAALPAPGLDLTGLLVTVPKKNLPQLDRLEYAYKRIQVKVNYIDAFVYVDKETEGEDLSEAHK